MPSRRSWPPWASSTDAVADCSSNEIGYSPVLLQAVETFNGTVGTITSALAAAATTAKTQPASLQTLVSQRPNTAVAAALQNLNPTTTNLTELKGLRGLNDDQRQELAQAQDARRKLDLEDPAAVAKNEGAAAKAHRARLDQMAKLVHALSQDQLDAKSWRFPQDRHSRWR